MDLKFGQKERLYSYFHNFFKFFDFGHFWSRDVRFSFFPYSLIQNFRRRKTSENIGNRRKKIGIYGKLCF